MTVKRLMTALSLLVVSVTVAACAGSDSDGGTDGPQQSGERRAVSAPMVEAEDALADGDTGTTATGYSTDGGSGGNDAALTAQRGPGLPDLGLSVIKTATVALEVKDDELQQTIRNATTTAEKYGGFVVSTGVLDDEENPTGSIVIRIPATRFGDALADLESLGKVDSENVSGQDVTQEFIDLQARLRNYVAQETVLLRLMDRAQSVTDTIRVQNELQRVQLEVERLRGRITYLEDQTAMSTIELRIFEGSLVTEPPGEFEKAWERARDGLVAVVTGLISSLGVVIPLALLAALVVFLVTRLRPRVTS